MTQALLTIPRKAGRLIVESGAVFTCPLMGTDRFVRFCSERALTIDRKRLIRLERLGLFAPVFRVHTPGRSTAPFRVPPCKSENWFRKRWASDTTAVPQNHDVPEHTDRSREGYYSIFQIDHLAVVLNEMTLHVQLDSYLGTENADPVDWRESGGRWLECAQNLEMGLREHEYRRAVALLCQHISNRYYPQTQTDMRVWQIRSGYFSDPWIAIDAHDWNWDDEVRDWDPKKTEKLYRLTPQKLRRAYESLAMTQAHCDPIERWYQLTQFISLDEREKLKGDALRAETLRAGAHMLRLLHKDLYNEELPHPNEVTGTVIEPLPELEVRHDPRQYLEFVANRFAVNPQPRLSLIVEGYSERIAVTQIFKKYFGAELGTYGIEIIVLGGVDAATGNKKDDRFRAIMRLIDYLHYRQTFVFLVLDNERYARKLKEESLQMRSIHTNQRYVTRPEYVKIWKQSFEFDNFSCTEIAAALNELARDGADFTRKQIADVKNATDPGAALKRLYRQKTNRDIDKPELSKILISAMFSPTSRREVHNRPIINLLERVAVLAAQNHLPITQRSGKANQMSGFLGAKYRPRSSRQGKLPP